MGGEAARTKTWAEVIANLLDETVPQAEDAEGEAGETIEREIRAFTGYILNCGSATLCSMVPFTTAKWSITMLMA